MSTAAPLMARAAPTFAGREPMAKPASVSPSWRGGALQAKLALGNPADLFERQADAAAAHVVGGRKGPPAISPLLSTGGSLAQRACAACALEEDRRKSLVQRKCACGAAPGEPCTCHHQHDQEEDQHPELRVDRKAITGQAGRENHDNPIRAVEDVISRPGQPLPATIRQEMEQGFGRDFSAVRIHDTPRAAASADGIGAHAYTVGNHIAFNRGRFQPKTDSGKRLIAHELAHTVQQTASLSAPMRSARISHSTDHHEIEAQHAARAVTTGAPMPLLSPGAAPISRYSLEEFGEDIWSAGEAVVDFTGDAISGMWDTAVAIAEAVGGAVSLDGTTIVIDVPRFDPCPEIDFHLQLSDIGLDPHLYFPIAGGAWSVGALTAFGILGVEANLDTGIGLHLAGCSFGPSQIRINPLGGRLTVLGNFSVTGAIMRSFGADLGLHAALTGILTIPSSPPIILIAPVVGVALGGNMELMVQAGGTISGAVRSSFGIGGVSATHTVGADIGMGLDLAYGLYGAVDIGGLQLCRVGWPLDSVHRDSALHVRLNSALSVGAGGLNFAFSASVSPLGSNPLADLGFAFDQSRLEDDCILCELFSDNGLLPGQNGYNWAALEPTLPRLAGPLRGIYQRDPRLASGALCRGTCGIDCPPSPNCTVPYDRVECEETGDRHDWHTYVNYASCGSHQGCRDHDACYDFAATMPIWGFGGYLIGPMYRACDLEAMCNYNFKQAVTWATGDGPYDRRLRYADHAFVTPGCYGPCPENVAPKGEPVMMETCLEDREIWPGFEVGDSWSVDFGSTRLYQGFVEVPWIVGVHYGIDASARADAEASATLGPFNLENACLTYDPATMTYNGWAELVLYLNGRAGASITGRLDGWLADFLCLLRAVNLGGWLSAGVVVQLPSDLRFSVQLYCAKGQLEIMPAVEMNFCVDAYADLLAGFDISLLGFTVHEDEWSLTSVQLDSCWNFELPMEPFRMGEMPSLDLLSGGLDVFSLLADLFDEAPPRQIDRRPPRNPIPGSGLLLPCLDDDDEDDDDDDCPRRATGDDGDRLFTPAERAPRFGPVSNLSIPGGDSAGVASWMEAPFLTRSHPPGSETNDAVQRGIYRRIGLPTNSCVGAGFKQSQVFVKGHLLNAGIGGPAEERNLFPITGQANANHKNQVEQRGLRVVPRVNSGNELIFYKVSLRNISAPSQIMTSAGAPTGLFEIGATFHCEVADYRFCENDTVQRNTPQSADITSEFVFHPAGGKAFDTIMRPCSR